MQEGQELESDSNVQEPEVIETTAPAKTSLIPKNKFTWIWVVLAMLVIAGIFDGIYTLQHRRGSSKTSVNGIKSQSVDTSNLTATAGTFDVKSDRVVINGQLQAAQNLVILPTGTPKDPQLGQIYLDKDNKSLFYYNGKAFVPLGGSTTTNITNLTQNIAGGGSITTNVTDNNLVQNITNITNNYTSSPGVASLQGATGALTLQGSNGLTVGTSGTSITLDLAQDITTSGNPQFASLSTNLLQSVSNSDLSISAGSGGISFTANGLTFVLPATGGSGQTICTTGVSCAAGGGQAVILAPNNSGVAAAQINASATLPSIYLNNTGGADLLRFQNTGIDVFTVANNGSTTIAGGNLTQTGVGTFSTGTGAVSLNGDTTVASGKNFAQTGVGTFSTGTGAVSLNGNTTVTGGSTLTVNGVTNIQADSTTLFTVQSAGGVDILNADTANRLLTVNGDNPATLNTWSTTTSVPAPGRYAHGSFIYGGNVYLVSGDSGSSTNSIHYSTINANGTLGSWTSTTSAPIASRYGVTVAGEGHVYVIGGQTSTSGTAGTDDINFGRINSDGSIATWFTTETKLLANNAGGAGVFNNGYIYIAGGSTTLSGSPSVPAAANATTSVQYAKLNADGTVGSFLATGSLPAARVGGTLTAANGYMYFVGGKSTGDVAQSQIYYAKINSDGTLTKPSDSTSGWDTDGDTSLPSGRAYHSAVALNGYLYIIGGGSSATSANATVYAAPLNSDGSLGVMQTLGNMGTAVSSAKSVTANGYIYNIGGITGSSPIATVQYTSAPRLMLAGSLDLVGLSGKDLLNGGSGGTLTAGNTRVVGTLDVSNEARFQNSVVVNGDLQAGGQVTLKNITDSETAFQIQNASGSALWIVDTANTIIQPGFARSATVVPRDFANRIIDATDDIGQGLSIAMAANGKPIIAAVASSGSPNSNALKVYKCNLADCSTGASTPVVFNDVAHATAQTSIAIGANDRLPIISYRDATNSRLGVLHCGNENCNSGNVITNNISGQSGNTAIGQDSSIAMGFDNLPIIASRNTGNNSLLFTKCTNVTCSTYNANMAVGEKPTSGSYANDNSLAINPVSHIPTVAFYIGGGGGNKDLGITRCLDTSCTFNATTGIDTETNVINSNDDVGKLPTLAFTPDGIPNIASLNVTQTSIFYVRCGDEACSSGNQTTTLALPTKVGTSQPVGLIIGSDGLPLITFKDNGPSGSGGSLGIVHCENLICSQWKYLKLDISGTIQDGTKSQVIFNYQNGLPIIIAGSDQPSDGVANNAIAVARCADPTCLKGQATSFGGGVSLGGQTTPFANIQVDSINDGRPTAVLRVTSGGDFYANSLLVDNNGSTFVSSSNANALQVKNASSSVALNIDTYGANYNLIRNYGDFETNIYGWEAKGAATIDQDPNYGASSSYSMSITGSAIGDGARYKLNLTAGRKYAVRFKALVTSGTVSSMSFGHSADGSTDTDCRSSLSVSSSDWQSFSCIFTPGAVSGQQYFYIKRNAAVQATLNIDNVVLIASGSDSNITGGEFENASDLTPWQVAGSATRSQNTNLTYVNSGLASMQVVTGTTADSGVYFPIFLNAGNTYTAQFSAKSTVSMSTMYYGYSSDGATSGEQNCAETQSISSSAFTKYSCTFSVPTTLSGIPYFYIKKTGTTNNTFYIDSLELVRSSRLDIISNGDVEAGTTDWTAKGSSTIVQSFDQAYINKSSLRVTTTAAANDGAKYYVTLAPSTTYNIQFYAKIESGTFTTMNYGYSANGSTETDCSTGNTVKATGWTLFSCSVTTGSTLPTSARSYFYIKKTSAVSTPVIFVDAFQIYYGTAGSNQDARLTLNGTIVSPTTLQSNFNTSTAFRIQDSSGQMIFNVDTINQNVQALSTLGDAFSGVTTVTGKYGLIGTGYGVGGGVQGQGFDGYGIYGLSATNSSGYFKSGSNSNTAPTLLIQDNTGQTGKALEIRDGAGTPIFGVSGSAGQTYIGVGGAITGSRFTINPGLITNVGQTIRGAVGQTADLFQLQDSSANILLASSASGQLTIQNNANSTTALRVLRQTGTSAFTVDTTNKRTIIGNTSDLQPAISSDTNLLIVDSGSSTRDANLSLISGNAGNAEINFGDTDLENVGRIKYDHAANSIIFRTNGNDQLTLDSTGNVNLASGYNHILKVNTQITTNTAGNDLTIKSATGNGTGSGGALNLQASDGGASAGAGGAVNIQAGNAGLAGGNANGGNINLYAGLSASLGTAGDVKLTGGNLNTGSPTYYGGVLTVSGSGAVGPGGVSIQGGALNGGISSSAGGVSISGGSAAGAASGNYNGGAVVINGGAPHGTGTWGEINLQTAFGIDLGNVSVGGQIATTTARLQVYSATAGLDIFKVTDSTATAATVFKVADEGAATFTNRTNSASAFQIQNAGAALTLFNIDTTGNGAVSIQAGASGTINIGTVNSLSVVIGKSGGTGTLTVNSSSIFNGTLTVNGHIISGNSSGSTTIAAGAGACTTPTVTLVAGSNDTAGTISVITGTGCGATGVLATVTFANSYVSAPRVIISANNSNSSALQYYNGTTGTSTFTLDTNIAPADTTTYVFNYIVVQ